MYDLAKCYGEEKDLIVNWRYYNILYKILDVLFFIINSEKEGAPQKYASNSQLKMSVIISVY